MRERAKRRDLPGAARRRELRRWIFVSALGHGLAVAALLWMPAPEPAALPGVISVDLVALAAPAASQPAARSPAPLPAETQPIPAPVEARPEPPKPAPPKPAPTPPRNEAVLPKKPERPPEKPKAKPEPEPDPEPKREVARAPAKPAPPKPVPPKPAPKQESYEDLLADLRSERGEARPDRVERPTRTASAATGAAAGVGRPGAVDPEVEGWVRAVQVHVGRAWMLPPDMRARRLMTELLVDLDARGNVLSEPRVVRGSGDSRFDENAVRAIRKASPLPPPPDEGVWTIGFCPECRG